jgi:nicotinamide riboside kinase
MEKRISKKVKKIRVAFTGPESSGKTTCAKWLAEIMNWYYVEEEARVFLEEKNGKYSKQDLPVIASRQLQKWDRAQKAPFQGWVADTEMTVMYVWSDYKYNEVHPSIQTAFKQQNFDLLFLCSPDIPWEYDPLREHPQQREELFLCYQNILERENKPFIVLSGDYDSRQKKMTQHIEAAISTLVSNSENTGYFNI